MRISFFSWLFFMLVYPLQLHFCVLGTSGQCLGDEQSSLLQFKNSIPFDSDRSTKLVHWNQSSECCLWEGVTCSKGRVVGLRLSNESISGRLENSSSLFKLHYLQFLDLSNNSLEGSFPISLFSFPSLLELQLFNNQFSGQLNEFVNVSSYSLETLDLSGNNLEGPIPTSVFQLKGLKILSLSSNNFSGSLQPSIIQQLMNLSYLDLSYNSLSIAYNETNSSFSTLPSLWTLKLASNKLKTFPSFLRNQYELIHLDLSNNEIHGEIPDWTWRLRNLYSLNLSHNNLVTTNLPSLNLPFLSILDLHSNQLQGQLSVLPPNAIYLDFSSNNISSIIPASIGNSLAFAYFFSLSGNKFYGTIPESICIATNLLALDLSNNTLSGTIPKCLIEMSRTLGVLNLGRNNLVGEISDTFGGDCALETLNFNGNQLEGELPKSLANCTKLELLDIGNNHIEDAFPCYLNNISILRILILRSNKFHGPISCLGPNVTWSVLQIFDLASNNFVGKFPIKDFSSWKAMMKNKNNTHFVPLVLQFESLLNIYYQSTVTITMKGLQMQLVKIQTIFTSLDFSCNDFVEPIPIEIEELNSLKILNLSHNAFIGKIPPSLGKLGDLESLDLSSNRLIGEIPIQLAIGLTFLSVLNLSFNQLEGKIPQINQFGTFLENSYEGNIGLCGFPLNESCTHEEPSPSPPTSGSGIDWNFLSIELGYISGLWIVIGPLMFWKRWRIWYCKHVDDILFRIFPQLYLGKEYRRRRVPGNQRQRR